MLVNLNTLLVAIPLFSSNRPDVQLTRLGSITLLFAVILSIYYLVASIGWQGVWDSALFHVSHFFKYLDSHAIESDFQYLVLSGIPPIVDRPVTALSQKDYWKDVYEKDTGQDTQNPNIIAARTIASGKPVTHQDINAVLSLQGHSITEAELEALKVLPSTEYNILILGIKFIKNLFPIAGKG